MARRNHQVQEGRTTFLPAGSLARHLLIRLIPPILGLVVLDLVATWALTHKLEVADWELMDIFWVMVIGQLVLIGLLAWVVVHGVGSGMQAVSQFSEEIGLRSADDLRGMQIEGLPRELDSLVRRINDLLARLDDSFASQRRFVAHAAHQLRTPLAGLKLESELMLARDLTPDIRERAERIKSASDRMIRLGQQLLVLARVDPDARPQDAFIRLDLCEWVRTYGAEWLAPARAAGIELQLDAPHEPVWVDGDPLLLNELLGNLIENAIRHATHATHIRLQVSQTPPALSVEDDGVGIGQGEQSRVFEAFYRSALATIGGSGLGLAIVCEIARAHGAWWNLVSGPEIQGTRLTVVFPGPRMGAQLTRRDRINVLR